MVKKSSISESIKFRVTEETGRRLKALAAAKGWSMSEVLRKMIDEYISLAEFANLRSDIQKYVADAVEEKLRPVENRIAKINAKTAHAAAISLYVSAELLSLHHQDVAEIFRRARQKAITFVRIDIPTSDEIVALADEAGGEEEES
jgi:predicted DNA-binding protein